MCGRFSQAYSWDELAATFQLPGPPQNLRARYNIAPTQNATVLRKSPTSGFSLARVRWGLLPPFAKNTRLAGRFINARSETASTLSAFKSAFNKRRCLIPADAYYEWKRSGKTNVPFRVEPHGTGLFALAGLWQSWRVPPNLILKGEFSEYEPGQVIETFTILTTTPTSSLVSLHDRMPVIISPEDFYLWLNGPSPGQDLSLLQPTAEELTFHRITTRINSVGNDDIQCIEPVN